MKKIFKKSLALAVSAALCLTALVGCLTVSAAGTATASISSVEVANGSTSATITVTIGSADDQVAAARFNLVAATGITLDTSAFDSTATNGDGYTPEGKDFTVISNGNMFLLEAEDEVLDNDATFSIPVTIADGTVATTYAVSFGDVLEVANYGTYDSTTQTWSNDEALLTVSSTNGGVTVAEAASTEPVQLDYTLRTPVLMVQEKYGFRIRIDRDATVTSYADYRLTLSTQYHDGADYTLTDKEVVFNPTVKDASSTSNRDYYFYRDVTAYALNVPITLTLEFLDGSNNVVAVANELVFSVAGLAKDGLANSTTAANLKTMYMDMLNYGTAAQVYFSQFGTANNALKSATPINDGCDDYQYLASANVPTFSAVNTPNDIASSGITCSPGLQIGASNNIYYRFTMPGSTDGLKLVVTHNNLYGTAVSNEYNFSEMTIDSRGRYVLPYDGVALYDSNAVVTATVMDGSTPLYELQYNIDAYVSANISNSAYNALFTALSKFTASANSYFASFL